DQSLQPHRCTSGHAKGRRARGACNSKCVKMILLWVWLSLLDAAGVGGGEFVEGFGPPVGLLALDEPCRIAGAGTVQVGSGGAFACAFVLDVEDGQPEQLDHRL